MKRKILKFAAIMLIMVGTTVACQKGDETETEPDSVGILPSSIEDVVDVFELKNGEIKECVYNGQSFKFSIDNIEDSTLPCDNIGDFEYLNTNDKIEVCLRIVINKKDVQLKVNSTSCKIAAIEYRHDETDIQHIWDMLKSWQFVPCTPYNDAIYFDSEFHRAFSAGTLIKDTPFSIFIAKMYPIKNDTMDNCNIDNSMYKFVFIITTQKKNDNESN